MGRYEPSRTRGTARSIVPTRVSQRRSRYPLRCVSRRSGSRSPLGSPVSSLTSASITAWASTRTPSRRKSVSPSAVALRSISSSAILSSAIVVSFRRRFLTSNDARMTRWPSLVHGPRCYTNLGTRPEPRHPCASVRHDSGQRSMRRSAPTPPNREIRRHVRRLWLRDRPGRGARARSWSRPRSASPTAATTPWGRRPSGTARSTCARTWARSTRWRRATASRRCVARAGSPSCAGRRSASRRRPTPSRTSTPTARWSGRTTATSSTTPSSASSSWPRG